MGNQIFAIGTQRRGELVHYDEHSGQFMTYLSGISAIDVTASRDGKWIAYLSYPDHTLWRCRPDGSERLQLTFPPMRVEYPRISPDGQRVAFHAFGSSGRPTVYLANIAGGAPTSIADDVRNPAWSPDSNSLVMMVSGHAPSLSQEEYFHGLRTIDLRNGNTAMIADSAGKGGPFWPMPDKIVHPQETREQQNL